MIKTTAKDYNSGKKRINLSLYISDYEDLSAIAKEKGVSTVGSLALSMLILEIRKQAKDLYKNGKTANQINLFNPETKKRKK